MFSLPWLLTPAPGSTLDQVADWLARWKALMLDSFQPEEIPSGMRVLTGCCLQWEDPCPIPGAADDPAALQGRATHLLRSGNPSHCDSVQIKTPLDRLFREDLEDFFHDQAARLARFTQGFEHHEMVDWVWPRTREGVFDDTVRAIYDGCRNGFPALAPTASPGAPA